MSYYKFGPDCQIPALGDILEQAIGEKDDGVFVDIGAYDGKQWSNTYGLAMAGWRGLLVEPQASMLAQARKHLAGKNVEFFQVAVSDYHHVSERLYLGGSLSTISEKQLDIYLSMEWSKVTGLEEGRFEYVPVVTYPTLMMFFDWPNEYDYLSIDVEGSEAALVAAADFDTWRPTVVSIETHEKNENEGLSQKHLYIDAAMYSKRYQKVYSDYINSVYVSQ